MNKTIEKIVSLCKQRGFVYQSSDIYGGFGAVYDYGPLGVELKNNIANRWWREMTQIHENMGSSLFSCRGFPCVLNNDVLTYISRKEPPSAQRRYPVYCYRLQGMAKSIRGNVYQSTKINCKDLHTTP